MERNRTFMIALAGLLGLSVWIVPCEARLVTVAITAEVTEVLGGDDALQGKVQVGDTITGTYTYDTAASHLDPPHMIGEYEFSSPPCGIVLEVGGHIFQADPDNPKLKIELYDNLDANVTAIERMVLDSRKNLPLDNGAEVDSIKLFFEDEYAFGEIPSEPYHPLIGLLSTALPATAPDLCDWPKRELTIQGDYRDDDWPASRSAWFMITAQVTSAALASGPPKLVYVDDGAPADGNGSSWDSAYRYLQDALVDANVASKPVEVRVAQGRYRPDEGAGHVLGDREAAFALMNEVTLKGGYAGLHGADPNARNPQLYATILTGDLLGDDLPGFHNRSDNSYHVVVALDMDESAVLDGFTITSGSADGLPADGSARRDDHTINGGGLYVDGGALTIRQCTFRGNYAYEYGGGAYLAGLPSRIHNSTFAGNVAGGAGGAYAGASTVLLQGCVLQGNSGSLGGAIVRQGPFFVVEYLINCTVTDNRAFEGSPIDDTYGNGSRVRFVDVYNSILWNDRYYPDYRLLGAFHSDIHGRVGSNAEANLDTDPRFAAPGHWADPNDLGVAADPNDPNAVWIEGDYHLKSEAGRWDVATQSWILDDVTSLCIDGGDPASLIDNEPVPHGGRINMGAYGGTVEASKSTIDEPIETTSGAE